MAQDAHGNYVVIENQLERSDHDHLGKLVTYLAIFGAKTAVWIVADPRPEHVQAINWLNEASEGSFYLVKLEAIRIESSPSAPLLTLIVGPSEESKEVGRTKKERSERDGLREKFWTQFLDSAKARTQLHARISPSAHGWVGTSSGKQGLNFNYVVGRHDGRVELYIDRGKEKGEENAKILDHLYQHREQIEEAFCEALEWQRLEGKRACRIRKNLDVGGYRDDEEMWPKINEAMADAMIRLEQALRPYIDNLAL